MQPGEMLAALLALAREAGIEVRSLRAAGPSGEAEAPAASGVCRVRGAVWVLLSRADPPEAQIEVLAGALRSHAGASLEERWLPPALRERLRGPPQGPGA